MRILIAIDGLSHVEPVLSFGAQVARCAGAPPTVMTVIGGEVDSSLAEDVLSQARSLLATDGPPLQTRVRVGHPAVEITREAEEGRYDLIVVDSKPNRNSVAGFLRASTMERIVQHAPCSVIVAKSRAPKTPYAKDPRQPIQRILLCDSGAESPSTRLAVRSSMLDRFTGRLAGLFQGAEITVLHVMSQMSAGPGVVGRQLRASATELMEVNTPEGELLKRDVQALARLGLRCHPKVRHGMVVDEIAAEAQSGDYDLVVIGAYSGEGWRRILLDDLAHRIIVRLDRPVLVVR
jgi:nucleotide-binding universal stress UspA family protein